MKQHNTVSRRDFAKYMGLGSAGLVASAAAAYTWSKQDGSAIASYMGQENRQGVEYFNRKPFEVDKVGTWDWEIIGPNLDGDKSPNSIHRIDMGTQWNVRFPDRYNPDPTIKRCIPNDSFPSNGLAGLTPYWQAYYTAYPMELDRDKEYMYSWLPQFRERLTATDADRQRFNTNEGFIANIRSNAQTAVMGAGVNDPPAISDWQGVATKRAVFESPEAASELIKNLGQDLEAIWVGISKLNPAWVLYTHSAKAAGMATPKPGDRGFGYDKPIQIPAWWEYQIAVVGNMNWGALSADPNYGDSMTGYNTASQVAQRLVTAIKQMGYPARWHSPLGGYDVCVPPMAVEVGLGQVGRTSNCIAPDLGGNARPAFVTTSLPMAVDKPIDFKMDEFCSRCMLCAQVCPVQAISYSPKPDYEIRGLRRFYTNHLKCSDGFNIGAGPAGCRACVAVCPWTKKNTWVHRFVREVLSHDSTGISQNMAVWAEKNLYPKNFQDSLNPPDFKGVYDPPAWMITKDYISGFTETPMGVK